MKIARWSFSSIDSARLLDRWRRRIDDPPEPDRLVEPARGDCLAVGGKCHAPGGGVVPAEGRPLGPFGHVPEPDRMVAAGRGDKLAVGRERQAADPLLVPLDRLREPLRLDVPEPDRRVEPARGERLAVGGERQGLDGPRVPLERGQGASPWPGPRAGPSGRRPRWRRACRRARRRRPGPCRRARPGRRDAIRWPSRRVPDLGHAVRAGCRQRLAGRSPRRRPRRHAPSGRPAPASSPCPRASEAEATIASRGHPDSEPPVQSHAPSLRSNQRCIRPSASLVPGEERQCRGAAQPQSQVGWCRASGEPHRHIRKVGLARGSTPPYASAEMRTKQLKIGSNDVGWAE